MKKHILPPIERHEGFSVVRGDLIEGGFKRLAIDGVFTKSKASHLVFASNSLGYGGIALTRSLQGTGKTPVIFLSENDQMSPNLDLCKELGAKIFFNGKSSMNDSEGLRAEACKIFTDKKYEILPVGLETAQVRKNIADAARALFPVAPKELWVAVGSGMTVRVLQETFPSCRFHAVLVKGNNPDIGKAKAHIPPQTFNEHAQILPPFNSSRNYDAKVWQEMLQKARTGAAMLNIA